MKKSLESMQRILILSAVQMQQNRLQEVGCWWTVLLNAEINVFLLASPYYQSYNPALS